ncbi:MAG: arginine--tRNA ligase [Alphaproteobacteria bacterium]
MTTNVYKTIRDIVQAALEALTAAGKLPAGLDLARVSVDAPREAGHGELSTNAAMVLAREAKTAPTALAELVVERLAAHPAIATAEVAGPGFVNLTLRMSFWHDALAALLGRAADYGRSEMGKGERVNVEYVSANPTGPLTVAHARGAVFGDALAALLAFAGYDVVREYYINDAGQQIEQLAYSTYARYLEALGEAMSEDIFAKRFANRAWEYQGGYLKPVAAALAERYGDTLKDAAPVTWLPTVRDFVVERMMELIKADLEALGIHQDVFTSERRDIVEKGKVEEALAELARRGLLYTGVLEAPKGKLPEDWEPRPQTLFKATAFGDSTDHALRRSNGAWTYFASDIAYHWDKFRRGARTMIDVWGADHGGHIKRTQAAVRAITGGEGVLDVKICQLVKLLREGQPVKMSKRAGTFVTLREVVDEVGKGVVRFIMLTRKNDAPLEFDLTKVVEQSRDNPVFYVQYAHARCHSVLRNAQAAYPALAISPESLARGALGRLDDSLELALIRLLCGWPRQIEASAEAHEPHRLAFYLYDLAAAFHGLWTKGREEPSLRFILESDAELTGARLALVRAVQLVIASGLSLFGVTAVEEMH